MKTLLHLLLATLFALLIVPTSYAKQTANVEQASTMLPPYYLSVAHWKKCASSKKISTWYEVCLPANQPNDCPNKSWQDLTKNSSLSGCKLKK